MKRTAAFFLFAAAITLISISPVVAQDTTAPAAPTAPAAAPVAQKISIEEFLDLVKKDPKIQIIDVRTDDFRRVAHLKDTANIPIDQLENRMGEIDFSRPVIVYCQTGVTSAGAAKILLSKNPSAKIYDLEGGLAAAVSLLSTEPDAVAAVPEKKIVFDALRAVFIAPEIAITGFNFPAYNFGDGKGKSASAAKLKGKPVLLAFFDAADLKQFDEILKLKAGYDKKKLTGFAFIPVAVTQPGTTAKEVLAYAKKKKWTGPLWFDAGALAAVQMRLTGLPNFDVIDAKGVLRVQDVTDTATEIDYYRDKKFEDMLRMVVAGKLPPFPLSRDELAELRQARMAGKPAPDFTLNDAGGAPHSLLASAAKGGAIVIFGSLHCPYTKHELQTATACASNPASANIAVMAVLPSFNDSDANDVKQYIGSEKITYPVLIDPTGDAFGKYYVSSIPSWWVISPDGVVRHLENGYNESICDVAAQAIAK